MIPTLTVLLIAAALAGCTQEAPSGAGKNPGMPDRAEVNPPPTATPPVADETAEEQSTMEIMGTVRHKDLEGGFYAIDGDDGEKYDPMNLPESFRKDGLKVRLTARPMTDMMSFRMYGQIIEVVSIKER